MTLSKLLKAGKSMLHDAGISEYENDAWLLLSYVTGVSRAYYYAHPDQEVPETQKEAFEKALLRRAEHIPLQYITGQAFFMGHEFYVDENVLIPRQETEILAEECLKELQGMEGPVILDMCTGSGCILTSLLLERQDAFGIGADISDGALYVAVRNAKKLGTFQRSRFIKSDLFSASFFDKRYSQNLQKYDILVSNPPYIRTKMLSGLMEEVRDNEPISALCGGEDGLFFYRCIVKEAPFYLKPDGCLLFETGFDQAEEVGGLMMEAGFEDIQIVKDLSGLDRVIKGKLIPAF